MSDKDVSKEGTFQRIDILKPLHAVGELLLKDGELLNKVAQTMKEVNDALKNLADDMNKIGKAIHAADASLQLAGKAINLVQVPNLKLQLVPVFGPTGEHLIAAGVGLHEIEAHLS